MDNFMHNNELILIFASCYTLVFLITWISKLQKSNRLFDDKGSLAKNPASLLGLHIAGIVWLGIVPLAVSKYTFRMVIPYKDIPIMWWSLIGVSLLITTVLGFRAGQSIQVKHENMSSTLSKTLPVYFILRILFLCAYELFFRGILLFECIQYFGVVTAIVISTGLTVLIHVFTNKTEMLGCIPFGIVLCGCCIALNAVWPAMLLHIVLSLAYELPPFKQKLFQLNLER